MICKDRKCTRMPTCLCGGNDAGVLQKVNLVTVNDGIKDLNPLRSIWGWKLTHILHLVPIGLSGNVSWLLRWRGANHAWNVCTSFLSLYLHYPHSLNVNKAVEMFEDIYTELQLKTQENIALQIAVIIIFKNIYPNMEEIQFLTFSWKGAVFLLVNNVSDYAAFMNIAAVGASD